MFLLEGTFLTSFYKTSDQKKKKKSSSPHAGTLAATSVMHKKILRHSGIKSSTGLQQVMSCMRNESRDHLRVEPNQ